MLATDTETGGLAVHHGCAAFIVGAVDRDGNFGGNNGEPWEWELDPHTRLPKLKKGDVRAVSDYLNSDKEGLVFHNAKYDLHILLNLGVTLPSWDKINCTQTSTHVLDSSEIRELAGLKSQAAKYLAFPLDDAEEVRSIALKARRLAIKIGWPIANPSHPHFKPATSSSKPSKLCSHESDMWIPRQIALFDIQQEKLGKKVLIVNSKEVKLPLLSPQERKQWLTTAVTYAKCDFERTMGMWFLHEKELVDQGLWEQYRFRMRSLQSVFNMERRGATLRKNHTLSEKRRVVKKENEHLAIAVKLGNRFLKKDNFNPNSWQQLSKLLYEKWKLPVLSRTKKGNNPGTDAKTLLKLAFGIDPKTQKRYITSEAPQEFLTNLISSKKFGKAREALARYAANEIDGVVHFNYWLTGTRTTRVSCEGGQNISKGDTSMFTDENGEPLYEDIFDDLLEADLSLRGCFGPRRNRLWYSIDCSQLQLRIFAYITEEKSLIEAFLSGWDAHEYIASRIFKLKDGQKPDKFQRRIGKNVNFGFIFGASPDKIEKTAGMPGLWDTVTRMFPNAHEYMTLTKQYVRNNYFVYTPGGYRLTCDKPHAGVNYKVQGSEGEIIQRAMNDCDDYCTRLNEKAPDVDHIFMTLQVHDELVFDCPRPSNIEDDGTIRIVSPKTKKISYQEPSRANLPYVGEFCRMMEDAGKFYGMVTPVDAELILHRWDYGIKIAK